MLKFVSLGYFVACTVGKGYGPFWSLHGNSYHLGVTIIFSHN